MSAINFKKWVINNPPTKGFNFDAKSPESTFKMVEETIDPENDVKEDQVLVKTIYLSNDPAQKYWNFSQYKDYGSMKGPGELVSAMGAAIVIETKHKGFKKGDLVFGFFGWSQYYLVKDPSSLKNVYTITEKTGFLGPDAPIQNIKDQPKIEEMLPHISLFRAGGVSALAGLKFVGGIDPKDESLSKKVFVVSGAAGGVGTSVVQIAANVYKAKTVIAIAGGDKKTQFLKTLGGDNIVTVDYKKDSFKDDLKEAITKAGGCDYYFDNVGGDILNAMAMYMNTHSTIIGCGMISNYTKTTPTAFYGMGFLMTKRCKYQSFIVTDHYKDFPVLIKQLWDWKNEGKLNGNEYVVDCKGENFANVPKTWYGLFEGVNTGKLISQISD